MQDEIVQKIVTTLNLQLTMRELGYLTRKTTDNLESYDYVLRGIEFNNRFTKEANLQARQMFERAIALDPQYAEAYARLGGTYHREWSMRWGQDPQILERAFELEQKALALDNSVSFAHGFLGFILVEKQQHDLAMIEGAQEVSLNPNNDVSYAQQAIVLNFAGKPEEALRAIKQAMRLNPHYPAWYLSPLGNAYILMGRYAEGIAALEGCRARNPNLPVHFSLVHGYISQWDSQLSQNPQLLEQALAMAQQGVALNGAVFFTHWSLGSVYLWQKQYDQAIGELERAVALGPNDALSYAGLADGLSRIGVDPEKRGKRKAGGGYSSNERR